MLSQESNKGFLESQLMCNTTKNDLLFTHMMLIMLRAYDAMEKKPIAVEIHFTPSSFELAYTKSIIQVTPRVHAPTRV